MKPRAILALGALGFVLFAYPGFMSTDSVVQLAEGRSGLRTNPHPPFMAFLWGWLDLIVRGPLTMFLLQGGLVLGALYSLFRRVIQSERRAAAAAVGVLLFPPVLTTMGVIWKDSQMAAWLLAGAACLLSESRRIRIGGLALLIGACAFRHNALAAVVPLVGMLFTWQPGARFVKRYATSGAAAILVVLLAFGLNRVLTVKAKYVSPAIVDIIGVLQYTHDRSDDEMREILRGTPYRPTENIHAGARKVYSARNPYFIDHGDDRFFDQPVTQEHRDSFQRAWKELIASDPGAYWQHRLASFRQLMGLTDDPLWSPVYIAFVQSPDHPAFIDFDELPSGLQTKLGVWFDTLAQETPLFRPYVYALLALLLLVLACRDRVTFAILASGLLYQLTFLFGAGTPDFRYSHWMVCATCVATVMLFAQRLRKA